MIEVLVYKIPNCDMCVTDTPAIYDAKTIRGSWAFLCQRHYQTFGIGLGTGKGQKLVLRKSAEHSLDSDKSA